PAGGDGVLIELGALPARVAQHCGQVLVAKLADVVVVEPRVAEREAAVLGEALGPAPVPRAAGRARGAGAGSARPARGPGVLPARALRELPGERHPGRKDAVAGRLDGEAQRVGAGVERPELVVGVLEEVVVVRRAEPEPEREALGRGAGGCRPAGGGNDQS